MSPRKHNQLVLWRRDYRDGRPQEENPLAATARVTSEAIKANQDRSDEPGRRGGILQTIASPRNAQVMVDLKPIVDDDY